jgi:hypothetical protein
VSTDIDDTQPIPTTTPSVYNHRPRAMASLSDEQASPARNALAEIYLERLADSVARIEFSYPAANLGLADICRDALARVGNVTPGDETASATSNEADSDRAIELLEAQQTLGLVPHDEYRRKRRELSRRLRQSRLAETPVLQRVVGAGTILLDALDEGLYMLGDLAEKVYRQRVSASVRVES